MDDVRRASETTSLDRLAVVLAGRAGLRFAPAVTPAEREATVQLRLAAVRERGWTGDLVEPDGRPGGHDRLDEIDEFDRRAVHLVGWRGADAACCGRIVTPPGPLPTELACGLVVQPAGRVVDVGRMVVAPHVRRRDGAVFVALLAALYLQTRALGYDVGCGMMAANVRDLMGRLGIPLEVLGAERDHRGEQRAPVRFAISEHGGSVLAHWDPNGP
jgi:hypothetical protein